MADREAAFTEQSLGLRAGQAGTQFGLTGDLVEPVQGIEAAQVEADHGVELAADRVQTADDAGAAAERDHGDALLRAVVEHAGHVVVVPGEDDSIGSILIDLPAAQQVRGGLAAGAQQSVVVAGANVLIADHSGQPVAVGGGEGGRPQSHIVDTWGTRILAGHSECPFEQRSDGRGQRFGQGRVAPGVPGHRG